MSKTKQELIERMQQLRILNCLQSLLNKIRQGTLVLLVQLLTCLISLPQRVV